MNDNKLMIGDWVYTTHEYYGEYYESLGTCFTRSCKKKPLRISDIEDFYLNEDSSFSPIVLTPKILELNEWRLCDENTYIIEPSVKVQFSSPYNNCPVVTAMTSKGDMVLSINYVHELQHILRLFELDNIANKFKVEVFKDEKGEEI